MKFQIRDVNESNRIADFVKNRAQLDIEVGKLKGEVVLLIYDPNQKNVKLRYKEGANAA